MMKRLKRSLYIAVTVFLFWIITNRRFFIIMEKFITYDFSSLKHPLQSQTSPPLDIQVEDDFTKLIDLYDFDFFMNHECNEAAPLLLVLVLSSPLHREYRKTIRETWGSIISNQFKLFFLLGIPPTENLQEALVAENQLHRDIIQGNFLDVYRNLTYKTVMALKYVKYFCPDAKFILKVDDDAFFNSPQLMKLINDGSYPKGVNNSIFCFIHEMARPFRDLPSKFYVSFREYSPWYYPRHCMGLIYFFPSEVALKLYETAQTFKYFYIEDVFLTGFVAPKANVQISSFLLETVYPSKDWKNVLSHKNLKEIVFCTKELLPEQIVYFWKLVS